MEVCGTEFRTDSSAQGKCWHSSNTFCKCSYLPPMPLDANSLPPHLRGMLCTCWLLTPPQAELHHGAADREQHATSRHRQQSKRRTSGSYGAQTGQGVWLSHLLEQADGKTAHCIKKYPSSGTHEVIPCFMEREKAVSATADVSVGWVLLLVLNTVVFLKFLHKQFNLPWDLGQYHGGSRAFIPLPVSFC